MLHAHGKAKCTFANRTLPDAPLVTLRTDQPINLVGAFEKPVNAGRNNEDGFVSASAKALVDHTKKVYGDWLKEPDLALVTRRFAFLNWAINNPLKTYWIF